MRGVNVATNAIDGIQGVLAQSHAILIRGPGCGAQSLVLLAGQQCFELFLIDYKTSDSITQLVTRHGILAIGE